MTARHGTPGRLHDVPVVAAPVSVTAERPVLMEGTVNIFITSTEVVGSGQCWANDENNRTPSSDGTAMKVMKVYMTFRQRHPPASVTEGPVLMEGTVNAQNAGTFSSPPQRTRNCSVISPSCHPPSQTYPLRQTIFIQLTLLILFLYP
ncbi:hypothetical protein E2C01_101257 [Portunus trituberculatus]|uniref:Uncharacterized protein n=1 Tax=Portunus trituberculatus TaxID=210409 RepID=A0A5B7KK00_PORTR|nr:hypothetical protein [Portunus trituberculatus]